MFEKSNFYLLYYQKDYGHKRLSTTNGKSYCLFRKRIQMNASLKSNYMTSRKSECRNRLLNYENEWDRSHYSIRSLNYQN